MIIFENPGRLDERSLFVMGLNAKPNTEAIGYFGTGLKYALAIAARLNWPVTVQIGDGTESRIEAAPTQFRKKDFTIPRYRDRDLPFTTELGKNWAPWQAYRELVCNAWDEGGKVYQSLKRPTPENEVVRFIVGGTDIEQIYSNHNTYFFDESYAEKISDKIFRNNQARKIYYRGILVGQTDRLSHYGYNFLDHIDLSEDRTITVSGLYSTKRYLADTIDNLTDESLLIEFFTAPQESFEGDLPITPGCFGEAAMRVARGLYDSGRVGINASIIHYFQEQDRNRNPFKELPLTSRDQDIIDWVKGRMEERGWSLDEMSVKWKCDFGPSEDLGATRKKQIGISVRAFEEGRTCVLATTLEEYVHAKFGYADGSRPFQDWFVRQLSVEIDR